MAKFMVFYISKTPASQQMASATPDEMKASMDEWIQWKDEASKTVAVEFGMPLQPTNSISAAGVGDAHTPVSGYSILEGDKEEVIEALKNHPHLKQPDTAIELLEFLTMPGM
ncbi:MAG TPA: hypothetical protein VH234_05190 [Candidatus Saccharimonadales bacterium]|jgi:hypothetical protein|nr:hypothetical protein [Candidatus Saccharimonadales bacterium]